ncbi:MAG: ferredoxin [Sulfobacillus acidophilus]|uniref:Ferredoxin n=1 Tax=Sulfobacillus acidophilus TaxID=53633 RepID=A0A2T2WMR5_9FIRM|nr:MAG: ferredoxin [Sulfobacillus acidophilus]
MEYNPHHDEYWNDAALEANMKQAFDICNGCRLCYNLCPSFPALFEIVEHYDNDATQVLPDELNRVADLCYQCKLCYLKCPYIPPHHYDLDFPRLMLRSKVTRAKKRGLSRADQFLGNPEKIGKMGQVAPGLANWSLKKPGLRKMMQRMYGIDYRRHLPAFAPVRFSDWVRRHHQSTALALDEVDVVIFSTCTVEYHEVGIGQAVLKVLQHNGIRAAVPEGQVCCGMPALDGGDIAAAVQRATANVALLAPYARANKPILALQPTCALLLKQDYPTLVESEESRIVAAQTKDVTQYLADAMKRGVLKKDFQSGPGAVTYHLSCHTKAQGLKRAAKDLLESIDGCQVEVVDRCAGIDGTWGLKAEYYDEAIKVSAKLTERFANRHDVKACSDCALAGLQIETATDDRPVHPAEILARAYGLIGGSTGETTGAERH